MADPSTEELPKQQPAPNPASLIAEAQRRYMTDPEFHYHAQVALWLSRSSEFHELDGAILLGACLALVSLDHPEIGGS